VRHTVGVRNTVVLPDREGFLEPCAIDVVVENALCVASYHNIMSTCSPFRHAFCDITGDQIDWQSKIALADIEKAYCEYMQQEQDLNEISDVTVLPPTPEEENSESPINFSADTNNQDNNVLNRDVDTSVDTGVDSSAESADQPSKNEDPDDIRIPHDAIETSDSIENTVADDACDKAQDENESEDVGVVVVTQEPVSLPADPIIQMPSKLTELLDNLCLIAPSAFRLVTDQSPSGSLPFITFHPAYLRQIDGDVLSTFDEAMRMYTSDAYSFFTAPSHTSWIDAVRDAYTHSTATEFSVPPLYSLLILRFHSALFDAYNAAATNFAKNQNRTASNTSSPTVKEESEDAPSPLLPDSNETVPTPNTSAAIEADVIPAADSPSVDKPGTSVPTADNETPVDASTADADPHATDNLVLFSVLPNLIQYLGRFDHISDEDVGKLVDGFKSDVTDLAHDIHRLEDMFLLPFSILLPKVAKSTDFEKGFEDINAGVNDVGKILQEQYHPAPVPESEREPVPEPVDQHKDVETEKTGEPLTETKEAAEPPAQADVSVIQAVSQDGGPGKKGKKKKKKKVWFIWLRLQWRRIPFTNIFLP
jgi:hypothetical protein